MAALMSASPDSLKAALSAQQKVFENPIRKVKLDRVEGQEFGVRLGNAGGPMMPPPVTDVMGHYEGKVSVGEFVVEINGISTLGMTMKETTELIRQQATIILTTVARLGEEHTQAAATRHGPTPTLCQDGGPSRRS